MRHGKKYNHLGRKTGHRKALLKNLSTALIEHKRINTTLAKAKALRRHLEPLITKAKTNSTHSRRVVFSYLQDKEAVNELFSTISDKIANRPGGYLRIIKTGYRKGDAAEMAMIEFVDFNDIYTGATSKGEGGAKKKRTRRGKKKDAAAAATGAAVATAAVAEETTVEDVAVVEETVVEKVVEETVVEKAEVVEEKIEEKVEVVEDKVEEVVEETTTTTEETIVEKGDDPEMDKLMEEGDNPTTEE